MPVPPDDSPDSSVDALPPLTGVPPDQIAPYGEAEDDGSGQLPPVSPAVVSYVEALVARIRTGSLKESVAAVRETLAQVGVATVDEHVVLTPAGPASIPVTMSPDEVTALALIARQPAGISIAEYSAYVYGSGLATVFSPPEESIPDMVTLRLGMTLAGWYMAGCLCSEELEVNFVPQFIAAMCRSRGESDSWLHDLDNYEKSTIDSLGMQLIAFGLEQALSDEGPQGSYVTGTLGTGG
jgi:hypothetical protein